MPPLLNFDRADYHGESIALDHCAWCERDLPGAYYRVNGEQTICESCAGQALAVVPVNTNRVFWRTVAWGLPLALALAVVLYALESFAWRYNGGFATGAAVVLTAGFGGRYLGKGMRRAAKGAGGRRYQIAAALLSYAAVAFATTAALVGLERIPWWSYPFLTLGPFAMLFAGRFNLGALQLMYISFAIRMAWAELPAWPLKIQGPAGEPPRSPAGGGSAPASSVRGR